MTLELREALKETIKEFSGWGGRTINQELEINRYTQLYIRYMNNKDLLYSTWNYIQYLLTTLIYTFFFRLFSIKFQVYSKLNYFSIHLKLTQLCKSTILQLKQKRILMVCYIMQSTQKLEAGRSGKEYGKTPYES